MKKLFNTLSQQGKRKYFVEKGRKKDFSTRKTEKVFNTKLYCVKRNFFKIQTGIKQEKFSFYTAFSTGVEKVVEKWVGSVEIFYCPKISFLISLISALTIGSLMTLAAMRL